jgi:hypothetical protein
VTAPRTTTEGCTCDGWKANIGKVNAPFILATARNPRDYKGYDGVPFQFCPWCAAPLASAPGDGEEPLTHCACRSSAWMPFGASYRCTVCHRMSREEQRSTIDAMFGVVSPVAPHAAVEEPESTVEMANASVAANPEGAEALVRRVTAAADDADLTALAEAAVHENREYHAFHPWYDDLEWKAQGFSDVEAAFLAAATPSRILALRDERLPLLAARDEARRLGFYAGATWHAGSLGQTIDFGAMGEAAADDAALSAALPTTRRDGA